MSGAIEFNSILSSAPASPENNQNFSIKISASTSNPTTGNGTVRVSMVYYVTDMS